MLTNAESTVTVDPSDNVLQALLERGRSRPSSPALTYRSGDSFATITAGDMVNRVRSLAAGLIGAGVEAGDRVAIFSAARVEWPLLDYAIWQAGAVGVTIYETSSPMQVEWIPVSYTHLTLPTTLNSWCCGGGGGGV